MSETDRISVVFGAPRDGQMVVLPRRGDLVEVEIRFTSVERAKAFAQRLLCVICDNGGLQLGSAPARPAAPPIPDPPAEEPPPFIIIKTAKGRLINAQRRGDLYRDADGAIVAVAELNGIVPFIIGASIVAAGPPLPDPPAETWRDRPPLI